MKTRLALCLGELGAAALYRSFLDDMTGAGRALGLHVHRLPAWYDVGRHWESLA